MYDTANELRDEVANQNLLDRIMTEAREHNASIVEVLVPVERLSQERNVLESFGFSWSGTVSRDQQTWAVFRSVVRGASGNILALDPPTIAPSHEEMAARNLMIERYGKKQ
ncbi:MAG: hypothetical protein ABSE40_23135 [Candidatus Sulfotelmatobacter sp.]|jgi:hypothetical protein